MGNLMITSSATPTNRSIIPNNISSVKAKIGNKVYTLEIARSMQTKSKGLSYRKKMEKDQGMLFVFYHPDRSAFTMHGMNFPLDFIWLKGEKIVDLTRNVPNPPSTAIIESLSPVIANQNFDLAIELNAGEIKNSGIKTGDSISFDLH